MLFIVTLKLYFIVINYFTQHILEGRTDIDHLLLKCGSLPVKQSPGGWRNGLVLKGTCCSWRGPRFHFQYPHGGSECHLNPAKGIQCFCLASVGWCTHGIQDIWTQAGTDIHKVILKTNLYNSTVYGIGIIYSLCICVFICRHREVENPATSWNHSCFLL